MEKSLMLQGKIPKLQQFFGKNWLQYGRACCQSRVVGGRLSKSVIIMPHNLYLFDGPTFSAGPILIFPEHSEQNHIFSSISVFGQSIFARSLL